MPPPCRRRCSGRELVGAGADDCRVRRRGSWHQRPLLRQVAPGAPAEVARVRHIGARSRVAERGLLLDHAGPELRVRRGARDLPACIACDQRSRDQSDHERNRDVSSCLPMRRG